MMGRVVKRGVMVDECHGSEEMCMITTGMGSEELRRESIQNMGCKSRHVIIPKEDGHPLAIGPINNKRVQFCQTRPQSITNSTTIAVTLRNGAQKSIRSGAVRGLNPGPLAPKARIIPLDQQPIVVNVRYRRISGFICSRR